ncbi:MAG: ANTAR domain-containing protein [Frankiaceae bacterium]|nr:ANTAR domain-containing protein [Frankiaceae bacterium]MBV9368888.1 ANTAR domain-containing protein [Frankiales bacterium]
MATRLLIGQAEGLLMARHKLDEDAAFALLVKLSQQTHLKLRIVAERIVRDHTSAVGRPG